MATDITSEIAIFERVVMPGEPGLTTDAAKAILMMDFAADDKDKKKTARVMLQMVATINHDYVSKIGTPPPTPVRVECVAA